MENQPITSEPQSGKQNPFEQTQEYHETLELYQELNNLNNQLIEKFTTNTREDFRCTPDKDKPERVISYKDYGKKGSKYLRDEYTSSEGEKRVFSYQIVSPSNPNGEFRIGHIHYNSVSKNGYAEFDISNSRNHFFAIESIHNRASKKLDTDGLHLDNREQVEWSNAWQRFFNNLAGNSVFLDALESSQYLSSGSIQRFPDPETIDLKKYVDDLEMLWNTAYSSKLVKKKFPRHLAPFHLGPKPPDTIYPHKEVQRIIQFAINQLTEDVRLLDEYQFPDKPNPYR